MYKFLMFLILAFSAKSQVPGLHWIKGHQSAYNNYTGDITTDLMGNSISLVQFSGTLGIGAVVLPGAQGRAGTSDIAVIKYDYNGGVIWAKYFGSNNYDFAYNICCDQSGNIYFSGGYRGPSIQFGNTILSKADTLEYKLFLVKLSPSGNVLWVKTSSGAGDHGGTDIVIDKNDNIFLAGSFTGTFIFDGNTFTSEGQTDPFIAKIGANGTLLWIKRSGGSGPAWFTSIAADNNGDLYAAGNYQDTVRFGTSTSSSAGGWDFHLVKYDMNGNLLWYQPVGSAINDYVYGITVDEDRNIYFVCFYMGPTLTMGSTTITTNIAYLESGMLWMKLDANGAVRSHKIFKGKNSDWPYDILYTKGAVYFTGGFNSDTLTIGNYTLTNKSGSSFGGQDFFMVKSDTSGNVQWAKDAGCNYIQSGKKLAADDFGNLYFAGNYDKCFKFDASDSLSSGNNTNSFIGKFVGPVPNPTSMPENTKAAVNVFPNPADDHILLEGLAAGEVTLSLINVFGEPVLSTSGVSKGNGLIMEVSGIDRGIYLLAIATGKEICYKKIILR